MPHKDIGSAIKEVRKALGGISQERFAHRLGMTTRTVSRWEAAESLPAGVLSRLRSQAIEVGARDAKAFFEKKIREDLGWDLDFPVHNK
jgi:transcriptional regulator with XRE-family HTH domain